MSPPQDPATRAARAGLGDAAAAGSADLAPAIALSSVAAFRDLESLDAGMEGRSSYRRYGSRPVTLLEDALSDLEHAEGRETPLARATASGQAALLLAMTLLVTPSRRRVVVVRPCYGGTDALIAGPLGGLGVQLTTVDVAAGQTDAVASVAAVLDTDVAVVITEVITNPLMTVIDVARVADAAHAAGAACLVDSTFTTPFLLQPMSLGADLVLHSLTKHLSGHSDVLGGMLIVAREHAASDWLDAYARLAGVSLGAFDAWLALRGLRTAALRVERGTATAVALALWFAQHPAVAAVHYPGRHGDAESALVRQCLPRGAGPMLSLELVGGRDAAAAFLRALDGIRIAPSLGDAATTVSHPALTSHRSLTPEARRALGISDGLVRISVGVESVTDLQHEFGAALGAL